VPARTGDDETGRAGGVLRVKIGGLRKFELKKNIFITYGLGPNRPEAENCVYGTGFKTTEA